MISQVRAFALSSPARLRAVVIAGAVAVVVLGTWSATVKVSSLAQQARLVAVSTLPSATGATQAPVAAPAGASTPAGAAVAPTGRPATAMGTAKAFLSAWNGQDVAAMVALSSPALAEDLGAPPRTMDPQQAIITVSGPTAVEAAVSTGDGLLSIGVRFLDGHWTVVALGLA